MDISRHSSLVQTGLDCLQTRLDNCKLVTKLLGISKNKTDIDCAPPHYCSYLLVLQCINGVLLSLRRARSVTFEFSKSWKPILFVTVVCMSFGQTITIKEQQSKNTCRWQNSCWAKHYPVPSGDGVWSTLSLGVGVGLRYSLSSTIWPGFCS